MPSKKKIHRKDIPSSELIYNCFFYPSYKQKSWLDFFLDKDSGLTFYLLLHGFTQKKLFTFNRKPRINYKEKSHFFSLIVGGHYEVKIKFVGWGKKGSTKTQNDWALFILHTIVWKCYWCFNVYPVLSLKILESCTFTTEKG